MDNFPILLVALIICLMIYLYHQKPKPKSEESISDKESKGFFPSA
jgi:hypothetical protein